MDPHHWQEKLESEYEALSKTLNNWYKLKQEWYQEKSKELHERLHELDFEHLNARYQQIKNELNDQRKSWQTLQQNFALAHAAS